jgi:hypothetical protein
MTKRRPQQLTKEQRRQAARKAAAALRESERKKRQRTWIVSISVAVVVIGGLLAAVLTIGHGSSGSNSASGDKTLDANPAALATTAHGAHGQTVDGISSAASEQLAFHVHSHLQIYVNGKQKVVPYGIGIVPPLSVQNEGGQPFAGGGKALYWLHTHDESGVVHIESPVKRNFTLGNFFDIWGQKLRTNQVGPAKGTVTAFVNGKKVSGNPADIQLGAHKVIQLDVGQVVAPKPFTFPQGL